MLVEWVDSFGCSTNWAQIHEAIDPVLPVCRSVGWLEHISDRALVVVPHVAIDADSDRQGCGDMTIPRQAVTKLERLYEEVPF
ncbi:MAG: hypothetical protein AAFQ53_15705 [Bacteroidota bacterium]